jgi:glycosyltransferase involved in cell wall biosynthesis
LDQLLPLVRQGVRALAVAQQFSRGNQLKFVHAAVGLQPPVGIVEQMTQEAQAAADLGLEWTVWLCRESDLPAATRGLPHSLRGALLRLLFFARLVRLRRRGARILLRHSQGDPFQYFASFLLGDFWTVHHTLEEPELSASDHGLAPWLLRMERSFGRSSVARARGIVCVTSEIANYELSRLPADHNRRALIYPNGVLYDNAGATPEDRRGEDIEVVFVASAFFAWHGLDRLLSSLHASPTRVTLHLVGAVPDALQDAVRRDRRIVAHGVMEPPQVAALVSRCWVGLSSFGLDRKGMTEACTLKVREYLRAGLPVYAGHRDAALPAEFPYFRNGPADIDSIAAYARHSRSVVRSVVADAARPHIDKRLLLRRLHDELLAASTAGAGTR